MIVWGLKYPQSDPASRSAPKWPGESWIWAADESRCRVVVDVGCAQEIGARAAQSRPDVVVLTHDDGDHIGGMWALLVQYAENPQWSRPELWLPVEWHFLVQALATAMETSPAGSQTYPESSETNGTTGHTVLAPDTIERSRAAHDAAQDIGAASVGGDTDRYRCEELERDNARELDETIGEIAASPLPADLVEQLSRALPGVAAAVKSASVNGSSRHRAAIIRQLSRSRWRLTTRNWQAP